MSLEWVNRRLLIPFGWIIFAAGCSPARPEVLGLGGSNDPTPGTDTTAPTVTLEQKVGQADPATVDGIGFTLTFSEAIDPATLTTADITQNGTATVDSWVLTQLSATSYELTADVVRGSGTVIPSIAATRFNDTAGNSNTSASSSADNSVTYDEPMATMQFAEASSVVDEGTGASAKTIGVTLSAIKSYDVVVGYVPAGAYTSMGDTNLNPASYTLTIPAGQTTANLSYTFTGDAETSKVVQLGLSETNSNAVQIGERQIHRQLVRDDDGGLDSMVKISAGVNHSCGITGSGAMYCWGRNTHGQLGDGSNTDRSSPTLVVVGGWSDVSAGGSHTCGIQDNGNLFCWGLNSSGQLGDASNTSRNAPVWIDFGTDYSAVSAGHAHTCAVTNTGVLKCWGNGGSGRLGTGATANVNAPTVITIPGGYAAVVPGVLAAGFDHTCVMADKTGSKNLFCAGNDAKGQLGRNTGSGTSTSFVAANDTGTIYTAISAGKSSAANAFSCGVTSANSLKCWGMNNFSQLGQTGVSKRNSPTTTDSGVRYSNVAAGGAGACGVTQAGVLKCWGFTQGATVYSPGSSTYPSSMTPTAIDGTEVYGQAAAGDEHRCALTSTGVLKCWGVANFGVLGDGGAGTVNVPTEVDSGTTYGSVSLSARHTCARTGFGAGSGSVRCWGDNVSGQLGDGQSLTRTRPLSLTVGIDFKAVAAGGGSDVTNDPFLHSCGLTAAGAMLCWGNNTYHQLGLGPAGPGLTATPTDHGDGAVYAKLDAEGWNSCAITTSGALKCWGDGSFGQLATMFGDTASDSPIPVDSGSTYSEVAVGGSPLGVHVCGIRTSGDLYCWGANGSGQLGIGASSPGDATPSRLDNGPWQGLSLGGAHSCAIQASGALYCWGGNSAGQLGDGGLVSRSTPIEIDGGTTYQQVALGTLHTCGITESGELRCWGRNDHGQVGNGNLVDATNPVIIDSGVSYASVSLGQSHTCGITTAGALKCWGSTAFGLLGDGMFQSWKFPTPVW